VLECLRPFYGNAGIVYRSHYGGMGAADERRDFLREVERNPTPNALLEVRRTQRLREPLARVRIRQPRCYQVPEKLVG
jgi:hypothetical protein